jgi:hypothetical protein
VLDLVDLGVEPLSLGPAGVHAQQHLGPVLALGAARPGVDRGDRVGAVVRAGKQRRELELVDVGLEGLDRRRELTSEVGIGLVGQQFVDGRGVVQADDQGVVSADVVAQARELRRDLLRPLLVLPQRWIAGLAFEFVRLIPLAVDVKGTPSRPGPVFAASAGARCARSSRGAS